MHYIKIVLLVHSLFRPPPSFLPLSPFFSTTSSSCFHFLFPSADNAHASRTFRRWKVGMMVAIMVVVANAKRVDNERLSLSPVGSAKIFERSSQRGAATFIAVYLCLSRIHHTMPVNYSHKVRAVGEFYVYILLSRNADVSVWIPLTALPKPLYLFSLLPIFRDFLPLDSSFLLSIFFSVHVYVCEYINPFFTTTCI